MTILSGGLKYSWSDIQKTRKGRKSHRLSGGRFCGELEMQKASVFSGFYRLPNKLALMGLASWAKSRLSGTRDLLPGHRNR